MQGSKDTCGWRGLAPPKPTTSILSISTPSALFLNSVGDAGAAELAKEKWLFVPTWQAVVAPLPQGFRAQESKKKLGTPAPGVRFR